MDKLLFEMPGRLESFIPAMAAVQSLCDQLEKQKKPDYQLTIATAESLSFFRPCFRNVAVWSEGWLQVNRRGYDLAFRFSEEDAYKLAEPTKMHIAKAFGIMIGSDPVNDYPTVLGDLSGIELPEVSCVQDVLCLSLSDELETGVTQVCQERGWSCSYLAPCVIKQNNVRELVRMLMGYKLIVGMRSGGTYLASSLKKRVVEIYPNDRYKNWLTKWANPNYFVISENRPELATIARAMDVAWNRNSEWVDTGSEDLMVRR